MPRAEYQAEPQAEPHMGLIITNTAISNELTGMPMEIILEIATYISQPTKVSLAQTCRGLSAAMEVALYDQDSYEDRHALWWACVNNEHKLLRRIIKYDPSLVNYRFHQTHAIKLESIPRRLMKVCAKRGGADFSIDLTPLAVAIKFANFDVFTTLLKFGANVNAAVPSNAMGPGRLWLPIHWVVRVTKSGRDFEDCVSLLVKHGANINPAPLLPGIIGACGDGVPLLEVIDFKPRFRSNREEPNPDAFYQAQLSARMSKARVLLRFGADPNFREPSSSETALIKAARSLASYDPKSPFARQIALSHDMERVYEFVLNNASQLFKALIDHGADPNLSCRQRTTALHHLCGRSREHRPLIYYLLQRGAYINATDEDGRTPIYQYLMFPRDHKLLVEFIKQGANVNHRDLEGRTPLHVACANRYSSSALLKDNVKALLAHGADPTLVDNEGKSPLAFLNPRRFGTWAEIRNLFLMAEWKASGVVVRDCEDWEDEKHEGVPNRWKVVKSLKERQHHS
ncbi:ankyrin [Daldinia decipiens]|uniref:ankyrin n=1 Tax=Daldinia decipiens TaxID=326647 RepID=UPI0020C39F89|nr:ankyrin [Daldinia decipiens]KAI1652739.1 ankyrin [Daldinia decipiens]